MTKGVERHELTTADVTELYEMLSYKRPHNSMGEQKFIEHYLWPLRVRADTFGNIYKLIGDSPVIAWSCHLDTCHAKDGRQKIVRTAKYVVKLHENESSNCLGADDTAGVWLMVQMIRAKVPGLYIFHRGEEVGCQGSRWIAKSNPRALDGIKFVVALDRRDNNSVITFQTGKRCCSDDFGNSLAKGLGLKYKNDPSGLVTDSAQYTDIIGECTNLSVGYTGQHFRSEQLDVVHIANLRKALILLDVNGLVSKRKAGEVENRWGNNAYYEYGYGRYHGGAATYENDDWRNDGALKNYKGGYWEGVSWIKCTHQEWVKWRNKRLLTQDKVRNKPTNTELTGVIDIVKKDPELVAEMLYSWGFDASSLVDVLVTDTSGKGNREDSYGHVM